VFPCRVGRTGGQRRRSRSASWGERFGQEHLAERPGDTGRRRRTGTTAFWGSLWEPRLSGHGSRWVGDSPTLYPRLALLENLSFVARLVGRPDREVGNTLAAVGPGRAASRRAEACSLVMLRRAELARVLPRDEAHAGLDVTSIGLVEAVVERVYHRGGASLVVSHDHWWLGGVTHRIVEITAVRSDGERTTMWRAL
jgi:hypothetical protein